MDSKLFTTTSEDGDVQTPSQPIMPGTIDRVRKLIPVRDEIVVLLSEYKVSKKNLQEMSE